MERSSSEERMTASPKQIKNSLFGLWTKRSTKVEPHPVLNETNVVGTSTNDNNHDMNFAKCSPQKLSSANSNNKRQYDNNDISVISSNALNSYNSSSDKDRPSSRNKTHINNDNGYPQNLNGNNSCNKNSRFSTQFSLCCKVDRKPLNTPVRVRYKSALQEHSALRRHHLSMNLETKPAPIAHTSECNSAPETPVIEKSPSFNSHSSPSTNSTKSTQSDSHGQPRTIAVTASRSRLRLKLLPPDKPIINQSIIIDQDEKLIIKETQHMSSPNISTNPEYPMELCAASNSRSMSHEGIQTINRPPQKSSDVMTQALMAAQVLSLIPTEKARERSYLDGRLGSSSLLGASELIKVLPRKEITIFIGTWNMNGQAPPKQMNDFVLPAALKHVPDLVAIGTQESCPERFEWEVTLQETLGPSHVLFHSTTLGTLHLAVYLRRDLIWYCSAPEDASMSVRPGTAFRTKGAVAISFSLFGTTMLFVTSHLTAHQQKVKERVQDVKRITHSLDLPKNLNIRHKNKDVTQNFDNVFWCGDLNFRLGEPREKLLEWIKTTKFPLPSHLPHGYMHTDQLSSVLSDGAAFKGFMEANITFPPTYKYDPGTQQFDTSSKQRAPAYTDRILFKYLNHSQGIRRSSTVGSSLDMHHIQQTQCLAYDSVPSIVSSDHKPVWALFKVNIRPGIDAIPLAAGLFNREVYVEGMKRRLNNTYSDSSAVCSIQ